MLFLTILFLALTLVSLVKGGLFYQIRIDMGEESIKQQTDPNYKPDKDLAAKIIFFLVFAVVYMITYFIYLTNAIGLDPLKYPSLFMLLTGLVTFAVGYRTGRGKPDLTNQEVLNKFRKKIYKKRTLLGFVGSLISVSYFTYMIYVIVFI